jgi:hypothetical protein
MLITSSTAILLTSYGDGPRVVNIIKEAEELSDRSVFSRSVL